MRERSRNGGPQSTDRYRATPSELLNRAPETPLLSDTVTSRAVRVSLKVRWRDTLALVVVGILVLIPGSATLILFRTGSGSLVGTAIVTFGALSLGFAGYLDWTIRREEARLRKDGFRWRVERNILSVERRYLTSILSSRQTLDVAFELLHSPHFAFSRVERTWHGVRATRPAEPVVPLVVATFPMQVDVSARTTSTGCRVTVTAQPAWIWLSFVTPKGSVEWVGEAEALSDEVSDALRLRWLDNRVAK
jgi:hypothetical protein